ncbi:hypothetical protein [Nonomuraea candida]|uniref:hypothetical protein n=1 Tax=Nonomuraea candida TaxID=359159 RepID=UPI0005B8703B|nr:hypothetical protein [Nonomuraea candida]
MVTAQHEGLNKIATFDLECTRDMLRALFDVPIPKSGEACTASPDLSEVDPGVCRADGAILYGEGGEKFGVIVETQRAPDEEKCYSWLEYIANFRSREKCPACLVVICPNERVARWAAKVISTGHPGLTLKVLTIDKWNTPVITDAGQALDNIALAVISTVTQSEHPRFGEICAATQQALGGIDPGLAYRYARYVTLSLEGDAQEGWSQGMRTMTYPYQGKYAEGLIAEGEAKGRVEGEARGEARAVLKILESRGLSVSEELQNRVMGCQERAVLDIWVARALWVESAEEIFD